MQHNAEDEISALCKVSPYLIPISYSPPALRRNKLDLPSAPVFGVFAFIGMDDDARASGQEVPEWDFEYGL